MAHQQRVSRFGESRQRPPLAFVLEEDILSTRSNKIM